MTEQRVTFRHRPQTGLMFDQDCFRRAIGRPIPLFLTRSGVATGELVAAEVIEDGAAVLLTVTCSEVTAARLWAGRAGPSVTNVAIDRGAGRECN